MTKRAKAVTKTDQIVQGYAVVADAKDGWRVKGANKIVGTTPEGTKACERVLYVADGIARDAVADIRFLIAKELAGKGG